MTVTLGLLRSQASTVTLGPLRSPGFDSHIGTAPQSGLRPSGSPARWLVSSVDTATLALLRSPGSEKRGRSSGSIFKRVLERTRKLWSKQDQHTGDRHRLFRAVAEAVPATTVLYPGSFVDIAPSFVWPAVTYVDVDKRANQFFGDIEGVDELLVANEADPLQHTVRFIHGDYDDELDLPAGSFDLLVSLYAGLVSEHCTRYLKVGGHLLVNSSHGDAALASIDPRFELSGVVINGGAHYRARTDELDTYLVPKRDIDITVDLLHETGRGVAYTKSPFAYIFQRVA